MQEKNNEFYIRFFNKKSEAEFRNKADMINRLSVFMVIGVQQIPLRIYGQEGYYYKVEFLDEALSPMMKLAKLVDKVENFNWPRFVYECEEIQDAFVTFKAYDCIHYQSQS